MDGILALVLGLCRGALAWGGLIAKSTRTVEHWVEDAGVCHFDVTADAARNHQALAPESDHGLDQPANLSQLESPLLKGVQAFAARSYS